MSKQLIEFTCADCGQAMMLPVNSKRRYCTECARQRQRRTREISAQKKRTKQSGNMEAIIAITAEAQKLGLSYGEFEACLHKKGGNT